MTRLNMLIDAWRSASCPAGGDPDAARWWDRWLEECWFAELAARSECKAIPSHNGRISWQESEAGIVGFRDDDRAGHYWIPAAVRIADQVTDDAWFACCEEERCSSFPASDILDDDWLLIHLPIRRSGSDRRADFASIASAGESRRFKPTAA